ncbi:MAG: DUF5685 family protein [Bacillota bacterium]
MFGYILPEKPHLYLKDLELYQSFYCGVCKSMGGSFCKRSQFVINYDVAFFCSLIHNYLGEDVNLVPLKCVTKPFTGRKMVEDNALTKFMAALNVLLSSHKLIDDVVDGGKFSRKVLLKLFGKPYKRAKAHFPKADAVILSQYEALREMEKAGEVSVDKVSDTFGKTVASCMFLTAEEFQKGREAKKIKKLDNHFITLCYNLGKWIYLIDAIDDVEDDSESGNYNVFLNSYGGFENKIQFLKDNEKELNFTFFTILNKIKEEFLLSEFQYNTDLCENIIFRGMEIATKAILKGEKWNNFTKS